MAFSDDVPPQDRGKIQHTPNPPDREIIIFINRGRSLTCTGGGGRPIPVSALILGVAGTIQPPSSDASLVGKSDHREKIEELSNSTVDS